LVIPILKFGPDDFCRSFGTICKIVLQTENVERFCKSFGTICKIVLQTGKSVNYYKVYSCAFVRYKIMENFLLRYLKFSGTRFINSFPSVPAKSGDSDLAIRAEQRFAVRVLDKEIL